MNENVTPKLSICIATMNRGSVIGETLESIVSQADDSVEIIVLDGASKDNTQEVVERYRQKFPALRYIRLSANGGVDKDFDRAVAAATGEFCWLASDDDLLAPGAIRAVQASIDRGFELVIVNAEVRTADMSQVIQARRLDLERDVEYGPERFDDFFTETAAYLSFIGCVVIRRSTWLGRERERYYGSLFIHMGVIFQAPIPGKVLVIAHPHIQIRYGNAQWVSKEFEIWMFKWPQFVWSFDCIGVTARGTVSEREPWRKLSTLLFFRAKGTYSTAEYRRLLLPRLNSFRERIGPRGIALIPGVIANVIGLLYSLGLSKHPRMLRVEVMKSRYFIGNWFDAKS